MPGVAVSTATRSGPTALVRAESGQLFLAILAERGSVTEPIRLTSMADYERFCGSRVTYGFGYDALRTFFAEGGNRAYVARVVGTGATTGLLTGGILDRHASTPVKTIDVSAANPGGWSANLSVEVQDGGAPNTFRMIVRENGVIVEDANNLASPKQAETYFASSPYIRVTDSGSTTAAPLNNPRVTAATALTAGNDQRASVTAATMTGALSRFSIALGDGAVAIPGYTAAQVGSGIDTHCKANRRIGILAGARSDSVSALATTASTFNSEYVGIFAPYVLITDDAGGTRAISPEGYVAAVRARAHQEVGPWRAPAGRIAVGRFVVGVDQAFSSDEGNTLDQARVSAIRVVQNTTRVYGWRSLSNDTQNYAYLTGRDLLNRLVNECEARLEDYVFSPIDGRGQLLSSINAELVGVLEPIRAVGGLYEYVSENGDPIDSGYRVDTGSNINTVQTLANNEVRARIAVRVSPVGALIGLSIVKVGVTAAL